MKKDIEGWMTVDDLMAKYGDAYTGFEIEEEYNKFHEKSEWGKAKESPAQIERLRDKEYVEMRTIIKSAIKAGRSRKDIEEYIVAKEKDPMEFEDVLGNYEKEEGKGEGFWKNLFTYSEEERKRPLFQRMFRGSL